MFERFTDRARRVIVLAQEEAKKLNHNYIGTEHLLLGLIHEANGVGAQVLLQSGVSLDEVRAILHDQNPGMEGELPVHIPFTPRAKKVLELALREALAIKNNYISSEHLLLGLLSEGQGAAANVLTGLYRLELSALRSAVFEILKIEDSSAPSSTGSDNTPGASVVSFRALSNNEMMITIDDPEGTVEITAIAVAYRDGNGNRCYAKWPADD